MMQKKHHYVPVTLVTCCGLVCTYAAGPKSLLLRHDKGSTGSRYL